MSTIELLNRTLPNLGTGKVRNAYRNQRNQRLLYSSMRWSAYDFPMPFPIPLQGKS